MSLESLKKLRIAGYTPSFMQVLVGNIPAWWVDGTDSVTVRPGQSPEAMDWRPVVGLHVDIFELGSHADLLERTGKAVDKSKGRIAGLARKGLFVGVNPAHERTLKKMWELIAP